MRLIFLFGLCLVLNSCATSGPTISDSRVPQTKEAIVVNAQIEAEQELMYPHFIEHAQEPVSYTTNSLFERLIRPENASEYQVEFAEANAQMEKSKTDCWGYEFTGGKGSEKLKKPSLQVLYYAFDPNTLSKTHNQLVALTGFRQKRELSMVKKDFGDSIAVFRTMEFGPELQYVVRVITGPRNMLAVIKMRDKAEAPTIAREEMIARMESLTREDIFPLEVVRHKVVEGLRDIELQFATSLMTRNNYQNECPTCAQILKEDEAVAHVIIKANRDAENIQYILERPLISKVVQQEVCNLKSMKEQELCIGSQTVIPGEIMTLKMQDENGNEIDNFEFCPNPIIVKSSLDEGQIAFELLDSELYRITADLEGEVIFESVSKGERMLNVMPSFKTAGTFYAPAVIGYAGGVAHLKFLRESGEELSVSLPWGKAVEDAVKAHAKNKGA
jgi:hypothetical protein